ncbi:MAG: hypothetical protein ACREQ5_05830 [Candidatus Dormibacteria bacterium]
MTTDTSSLIAQRLAALRTELTEPHACCAEEIWDGIADTATEPPPQENK